MSSPLTVLVGIYSPFAAWNIPPSHVDRLRRAFPQHVFLHAANDEQSLRLIPAADAAFMADLRPAQFAAAKELKWVHSPAAGLAGMLFPEMVQSQVVMTNSRGISAGTIAEHVIAVTLALFRKFPLAFQSQAAREWAQNAVLAEPPIRTIAGTRALVIGLGSIGMASARLFDSVRCTRHGNSPRSDITIGTGAHRWRSGTDCGAGGSHGAPA